MPNFITDMEQVLDYGFIQTREKGAVIADFIEYIFFTLMAIGVVGAVIPLFNLQVWWLRAWTYARIQLLYLAALLYIFYHYFYGQNALMIIGLIVIIGFCLKDIFAFTVLGSKQTKDADPKSSDRHIKLLAANVLMENDNYQGLVKSIEDKDPDIILMVETDEKWRDYMSEVEANYPHNFLLPLPDHNGMLFYSKFPILNVEDRRLIQNHIPSLKIDLELEAGNSFRVYGVHPRPPRPQDDTADMDHELLIIAKEVEQTDGPTLVMGDLNDVGWSPTTKRFLAISEMQDPRRGRGLFNTFNAKNILERWPLDHIFHTPHFKLVQMQRLPKFGSDHFPMFVELTMESLKD